MSLFKSKYSDIDIDALSDDEVIALKSELVKHILIRGLLNILLLIGALIALYLGGKYAW